MEDVISRLLDAEVKAETIVGEANRQKEVLINEARDKALLMEQQFEANRDTCVHHSSMRQRVAPGRQWPNLTGNTWSDSAI